LTLLAVPNEASSPLRVAEVMAKLVASLVVTDGAVVDVVKVFSAP
jgi:hypothetical protein